MTWAGERGERFCSFQSPGLFFSLTLPFIERAKRDLNGTGKAIQTVHRYVDRRARSALQDGHRSCGKAE